VNITPMLFPPPCRRIFFTVSFFFSLCQRFFFPEISRTLHHPPVSWPPPRAFLVCFSGALPFEWTFAPNERQCTPPRSCPTFSLESCTNLILFRQIAFSLTPATTRRRLPCFSPCSGMVCSSFSVYFSSKTAVPVPPLGFLFSHKRSPPSGRLPFFLLTPSSSLLAPTFPMVA